MKNLPVLPSLPLGEYRHYKGTVYEVLGVALHSETLEPLVLYTRLKEDGTREYWVRPYSMFLEQVEYQGEKIARFTKI